jgi:copper chaperone
MSFLFSHLKRSITMQTELLKIAGMRCGGCTSKVTHALQAVSGVNGVKVSLSTGNATVKYNERRTSPEQLKAAVKGAGYSVNETDTARKPQGKGGCCCG